MEREGYMKINYITGLKGICCVIVSLGHMIALLLPELYFGTNVQSHTELTRHIYELPFGILYNSSSALMCFLLLSGFVIPLKRFRNEEKINVLDKWFNKYLRLMPMALIGIFMGWIIMKADWVYSYKIVDLSYSNNYAANFNHFQPAGVWECEGPIYEALIRVFILNSPTNSPLGTLKYIWQFSFVLLIFTKWLTKWRYRDIIYMISALFLMVTGKYRYENYYYLAMLLGMWICDGMFHSDRKRHLNSLPRKEAIVGLVIGICLLTIPYATPVNGIYKWVAKVPISHTLYWILGWTLTIIGISNIKIFQKILESSLILSLGKISYGYYAVHWPIVISFSCFLTWTLYTKMSLPYVVAASVAILMSIPVIILFAWIAERYVYNYLYKGECFLIKKLVE